MLDKIMTDTNIIKPTKYNNPAKIVTEPDVRWAYVNIWRPISLHNDLPRYRVCLIIPKSDTKTIESINNGIRSAYNNGSKKLIRYSGNIPPFENIKSPLKDGDINKPYDTAFANSYYINASSQIAPKITDINKNIITRHSEIYSGVHGKATIMFYAYGDKNGYGIACLLCGLQKYYDDTPIGNGSTIISSISAAN